MMSRLSSIAEPIQTDEALFYVDDLKRSINHTPSSSRHSSCSSLAYVDFENSQHSYLAPNNLQSDKESTKIVWASSRFFASKLGNMQFKMLGFLINGILLFSLGTCLIIVQIFAEQRPFYAGYWVGGLVIVIGILALLAVSAVKRRLHTIISALAFFAALISLLGAGLAFYSYVGFENGDVFEIVIGALCLVAFVVVVMLAIISLCYNKQEKNKLFFTEETNRNLSISANTMYNTSDTDASIYQIQRLSEIAIPFESDM